MPVPDFSPGEVLTAAAMDSIGLWKVASVTATSGTVVNIQNCFSANYDAYRVVITDFRTVSVSALFWQLANSGTPANSNYYWNYVNAPFTSTTSYSQQGSSSDVYWATVGVGDTNGGGVVADIFNPFLARTTIISADRTDCRIVGTAGRFNGGHTPQTSYSGLYLTTGVAITNLTATVYGYRK
jgi:hypothetical protein